MKVILVTVSDDRMGRKGGIYRKTQVDMVEKLKPFQLIDEFYMPCWDDIIITDFYKHNHILLDHIDPARNGRAYKPFAISEALKKIDDGDILIYQDCSPEMWNMDFIGGERNHLKRPDIHNLDKLLDNCGGIIAPFVNWDNRTKSTHALGIHTHENFTTDLCINTMHMEKYKRSFQCASGMFIIKKSAKSSLLVNEWLYWNSIDKCCAMGPADDEREDRFSFWSTEEDKKMGHRHDQSILGLLMNAYQPQLVQSINLMHPYVFLNYCMTPANEIQLIDSNYNPEPIREINKGDIVALISSGVPVKVFEIWPYNDDTCEKEIYIVGMHRESAFKAYRNEIKKL